MPRLVETNLTDNAVRTAKPKGGRYDLYDAKVRGLGLRVSPAGTKSWFAMRRVRGQMTRKTIGRYPETSLADARSMGAKLLVEMELGDVVANAKDRTVETVIDEWFEREQNKKRTGHQVRVAFGHDVLPYLGTRKLRDIQKADIHGVIDKIMDRDKGVQANRVLSFMRRFFNWCIERDYLAVNPTQGIPKPYSEKSKERVLTQSEIGNVVRAAEEMPYPFGPYFLMLILTGQRRVEVASVEWSDVDLAESSWTIPGNKSKNGRAHVVHLSKPVLDVLIAVPRDNDAQFVFTTKGDRPISGYSKSKKRLDAQSGVENWTLHDLRRSFATHATEKLGFGPAIIDKVLNHQSGTVRGVAAVYQKGLYLEERADALDAWGDWVMNRGERKNRKMANGPRRAADYLYSEVEKLRKQEASGDQYSEAELKHWDYVVAETAKRAELDYADCKSDQDRFAVIAAVVGSRVARDGIHDLPSTPLQELYDYLKNISLGRPTRLEAPQKLAGGAKAFDRLQAEAYYCVLADTVGTETSKLNREASTLLGLSGKQLNTLRRNMKRREIEDQQIERAMAHARHEVAKRKSLILADYLT